MFMRQSELFLLGQVQVWPASMMSVTVAGCDGMANLAGVPSLRSFCSKGSFFAAPFSLPRDATLDSLCIYFDFSVLGSQNTGHPNNTLPSDLSCLTVLNVCWETLPFCLPCFMTENFCQLPKQRSLHSLRELHLIMFKMEAANLADIYVFLKTFQCPNMERLFVQLLSCIREKDSHDEFGEEPPENCLDKLKIVKCGWELHNSLFEHDLWACIVSCYVAKGPFGWGGKNFWGESFAL
ncbi:hypothetical protein ACP4OV_013892 [Aristida adscensionis]